MSPNTEKTVEVQAYDYNAFTGKIIWATPEIVGANCIASAELLPNTQSADKLYGDKFISYKNLKITSGANICNGKINLKVSDDGIINVSDSAMESDLYVVNVAINNQLPSYPSGIKTYSAQTVVGYPWSYSIKASDAEDKTLTYEILDKPSWLSIEGAGSDGKKITSEGIKISGTPNASGSLNFSIQAKDSKGGSAALAITLNITNSIPVINAFPVDADKHINENFSDDVKATDADGHTVTYSMTCTPEINCGTILAIDSASGKISSPDNFIITDYGIYNFTVTASDGYGGVASKNFTLKITPFCGNNVVENWVVGGIAEQCESAGNGTNVNNQYNCVSCKWSGGWCGDSTVQNGASGTVDYKEQCEIGGAGTSINDQYVCASCKWSGGWCGDGIVNGSEECETGGVMGGKTCQTLGYALGDLSCNNNCSINASQCKRTFLISGNVKDYMTASNLSGAKLEVKIGNEVIKK